MLGVACLVTPRVRATALRSRPRCRYGCSAVSGSAAVVFSWLLCSPLQGCQMASGCHTWAIVAALGITAANPGDSMLVACFCRCERLFVLPTYPTLRRGPDGRFHRHHQAARVQPRLSSRASSVIVFSVARWASRRSFKPADHSDRILRLREEKASFQPAFLSEVPGADQDSASDGVLSDAASRFFTRRFDRDEIKLEETAFERTIEEQSRLPAFSLHAFLPGR